MAWRLSNYRTGDLIEIRSKEEILATLDNRGCLNGMPLMPEMLQFCGRRFKIGGVAHKACDMIGQPGSARRLQGTVHLAGVRCDGSHHDGCQAECNLFWKDEWLKPAGESQGEEASVISSSNGSGSASIDATLLTNETLVDLSAGSKSYFCQATEMYKATEPLAWWDVRQYVFDVITRNHTAGRVCRVLFLACLRWWLAHLPFGYRFFKRIHDYMHQRLTGRPSPSLHGKIPYGARTPSGRLDLKPGENVRIKSKQEIEETIHMNGRNRGLRFDPEEMAPFCGGIYKVRSCVSKIIDETTGKMLHMKEPCIMLEGVTCRAEYASCRLNCPRAIPSYWRELWLERVEKGQQSERIVNE